ncbi:MAG TPA: flagellar assembly protein FliW [Acidimicrobiales bacterium]
MTDDERAATGERVLEFVRPIIGWEESTRFALRSLGTGYAPYLTMTSLDQAGLQFVVVPPGRLFADYVIEVPAADRQLLGLDDRADVLVLAIVRRRNVATPVVNLMGPIVVNRQTGSATQVVLQDAVYGAAVPIAASTARPLGGSEGTACPPAD